MTPGVVEPKGSTPRQPGSEARRRTRSAGRTRIHAAGTYTITATISDQAGDTVTATRMADCPHPWASRPRGRTSARSRATGTRR